MSSPDAAIEEGFDLSDRVGAAISMPLDDIAVVGSRPLDVMTDSQAVIIANTDDYVLRMCISKGASSDFLDSN